MPSSKAQPNLKFSNLNLGFWILALGWTLVFGAWDFARAHEAENIDVDLFARVDGVQMQLVEQVTAGSRISFTADVDILLGPAFDYTFSCGTAGAAEISGKTAADKEHDTLSFECDYPLPGVYTAMITLTPSPASSRSASEADNLSDWVKVYVGDPAPEIEGGVTQNDFSAGSLRMFLWGVIVAVLAYAIGRMARGGVRE